MKNEPQTKAKESQPKVRNLSREDKRLARRYTETKQLRYVTSLIHGFEGWWPVYSSCRSELSKEKMLEYLWRHRAKLLKKEMERSEASAQFMKAKGNPIPPCPPHPFIDIPEVERAFPRDVARLAEKTTGVAHASFLYEYYWDKPDRPDDTLYNIIFSRPDTIANLPIADGANIYCFFATHGGFPMSLSDSVAHLGALQFDFPAVSFDALLHYCTTVVIGIPTGATVIDDWGWLDDKDWGFLDIDFVICDQPEASGPPNFWSYNWYQGIYVNKTTNSYIWTKLPIYGQFEVKKNTQSRAYIGISIQMMGADCYVSTGASNDPPDHGYFDLRTPDWAPTDSFYGVYYDFRRQ
ncbi:hypothetical protein ES702_01013 [subsurface metagenome]